MRAGPTRATLIQALYVGIMHMQSEQKEYLFCKNTECAYQERIPINEGNPQSNRCLNCGCLLSRCLFEHRSYFFPDLIIKYIKPISIIYAALLTTSLYFYGQSALSLAWSPILFGSILIINWASYGKLLSLENWEKSPMEAESNLPKFYSALSIFVIYIFVILVNA